MLYSDDDEKLFFSVRPQIVNGIGEFIMRSDFLDRTLTIRLPVVPKSERKPEKEIYEEFENIRPAILVLCTAASEARASIRGRTRRARSDSPATHGGLRRVDDGG